MELKKLLNHFFQISVKLLLNFTIDLFSIPNEQVQKLDMSSHLDALVSSSQ